MSQVGRHPQIESVCENHVVSPKPVPADFPFSCQRSHPLDSIDLPARPILPSALETLMISVLIIEPDIRASGEDVKKLPFFARHIKARGVIL